jgi:hypothetical protein
MHPDGDILDVECLGNQPQLALADGTGNLFVAIGIDPARAYNTEIALHKYRQSLHASNSVIPTTLSTREYKWVVRNSFCR